MSTPSDRPGTISRRTFFQSTALIAAPLILPSRLLGGQYAPSNRIRVGHIGCGRIGQTHDMPGVAGSGLADVLAVADVDSRRAASGKQHIAQLYASAPGPRPEVTVYSDYKQLLARSDIDAVVVSLPDHQHAEVVLRALYAGKDVYVQKPFTLTHAEGVLLRDTVKKTGRVLQVGSQQRSWGPNEQFRKAVELVRSGRVGHLTHVEIGLPTDPTKENDPPQPVPPNLNYDVWMGPTPEAYYTEQRVHPQGLDRNGNPDVNSRPGWLRNESYTLGMITGWGAHHFDTAHWGMDLEHTGPSRIEGKGEFPANKIWNVHGAYHVELQYPRGMRLTVSHQFPNGIQFSG